MWEYDPGIYEGVSITSIPIDQGTSVGKTVIFNIYTIGSTPYSYAWKKDNVIISGEKSSSYTTPYFVLSDIWKQYVSYQIMS